MRHAGSEGTRREEPPDGVKQGRGIKAVPMAYASLCRVKCVVGSLYGPLRSGIHAMFGLRSSAESERRQGGYDSLPRPRSSALQILRLGNA
jgi:hypothetical protein